VKIALLMLLCVNQIPQKQPKWVDTDGNMTVESVQWFQPEEKRVYIIIETDGSLTVKDDDGNQRPLPIKCDPLDHEHLRDAYWHNCRIVEVK